MSSELIGCNNDPSIFYGIPYLFFPNDTTRTPSPITGIQDNHIRFWIHMGLVIAGFLLAVVSFFAQLCKPASYGKHADGSGRCPVPAKIAFGITDFIPGFIFFTLTYFIAGQNFRNGINITMYMLFTVHYLTRGLMTVISKYTHNKVSVFIPVGTFVANTLYHYINAEFIGSVYYCRGYYYDPRFIVGLLLFLIGITINRAADLQLIYLRRKHKDRDYVVPKGPLFYLISCPNYFGEGLQWFGWAIMTWSLAGLVWWLFTESTFITRARHNHKWYRNQYLDYPPHRRALIPLIY